VRQWNKFDRAKQEMEGVFAFIDLSKKAAGCFPHSLGARQE
jgi:hypothetical protein